LAVVRVGLPAADEHLLGELTKRCRTSGLELASGISSPQAAAASASAVTVLTGDS
jgi:hypothetical protein